MELSELQKEILNSKCTRSVVISSAASGKTRLLTEKVRQLLRANINPHSIAVITFTNMAATELRQRLDTDYKDGLFVGTIHALANYMLCRKGIDTNKIIDNEEFDKLFELIYQNPQAIIHYRWILLDEAQDSDKLQFNFLFNQIAPENFFVVGDPKQAIYGFKGSDYHLIYYLVRKYGATMFDMNENYRNSSKILTFAKDLIKPTGLLDQSISMTGTCGEVFQIPFSTQIIIDAIKEDGNYKNWAILTRTNKEIYDISYCLKINNIPFDTFKQGDLTKDELSEKMTQDTVKVLTVHSAKGLEWDNVIVVGMRYYNNEERNVCYVAATRARKKLMWMRTAAPKRKASIPSY